MKQLLFVFFLFFSFLVYSQTDSVVVETYDLIYLKNGKILKGQIISFDPSDGDISFVSTAGLKYFLTTKDYEAYKENIPAKRKKKTQGVDFELRERKENQFEFSLGMTAPAYFITGEKSVETDNHLPFERSYIPICISAGFGKYFDRKHYIGLGFDFDVQSTVKSFYSVNLRYTHQYDAYKKNTSLYLPIELSFNHFRNRMPYQLDETDTSFFSDGSVAGTSYPKQTDYDVSFNSVGFSIGQGFGFMLTNKNSIAFDISLFKYFALEPMYHNVTAIEPSYSYTVQGFKMTLRYNF
ncbi:MAG: hypothetical protein R3279_13445 [Putridiphycobacter sp.]|nr:hypothetical protein [Putridiphycobacter sp.]